MSIKSRIVLSLLFPFLLLLLLQIFSINHLDNILANSSSSSSTKIIVGNRIHKLIWCPVLHLYRINGKPVLWMFWDKKALPVHIKLSLATILCHNDHDFHLQLVSDQEIYAWTGVIHPAYQYLISAHKGDYFRGRVLADYGGMYLDADTIGLHNVKHLFAKLKDYDVVNSDWWPDRDPMYLPIMGPMRANTTLMRQFVQKQDLFLTSKLVQLRNAKTTRGKYPIQWNEMLLKIMNSLVEPLLNEKAYLYYKMDGPKTFGQLAKASLSMKPRPRLNSTKQYVFKDTELLTYYNSRMDKQIGKMSEKEFLQSDLLIPTLIRFTMKRCKNNNFTDFALEKTKVTIGENEKNVDQNLVKWIIYYTKFKRID